MSALIIIIFVICFQLFYIKTSNAETTAQCNNWPVYTKEKCIKLINDGNNDMKTYKDAERVCARNKKSQLLSIHSEEENEFIISLLYNQYNIRNNVWIGAQYENNAIKWIDNSSANYTNFDQTTVKTGLQSGCVQMSFRFSTFGKWIVESCDNNNVVVCQRNQSTLYAYFQKQMTEMKIVLDKSVKELNDTKNTLLDLKFSENLSNQMFNSVKFNLYAALEDCKDEVKLKFENSTKLIENSNTELKYETVVLINELKKELTDTRIELTNAKNDLISNKNELISTNNKLISTESKLMSTINDLINTKSELSSVTNQFTAQKNTIETKSESFSKLILHFLGMIRIFDIGLSCIANVEWIDCKSFSKEIENTRVFVAIPRNENEKFKNSMQEAMNVCKKYRYELLSIESNEKQTFVSAYAQSYKTNIWTSGERKTSGNWYWDEDNQVTYTNWKHREPNNVNGNENCLIVCHKDAWQWNDVPCHNSNGKNLVICQLETTI